MSDLTDEQRETVETIYGETGIAGLIVRWAEDWLPTRAADEVSE